MTTFLSDFYKRYQEQREPAVVKSVALIRAIVGQRRYPSFEFRQSTYVSFNGGKDATVALFLTVLAYCEQVLLRRRLGISPDNIKTLFFIEPEPFEEVDEFMEEMRKLVGFQELKAERDFKKSLRELKQEHEIDAIIMGSRSTDPYCQHLSEVTPSDVSKGYPRFDRVNPIIDWTYSEVWSFIRSYKLPYCKLYEKGYTYLGNKSNTVPNPQLEMSSKTFMPAWEAPDNSELLSRK